jgi:hypothetical protein
MDLMAKWKGLLHDKRGLLGGKTKLGECGTGMSATTPRSFRLCDVERVCRCE